MNDSERDSQHQAGLDLIKQFVEKYPSIEHASVNDDLIDLFCRGAKLLGIKHIFTKDDHSYCPECKFDNGEIKALSLYTTLGGRTLCIYCSYAHEDERLDKHNHGDCNCPDIKGDWDTMTRQWTKSDCLLLFQGYLEMHKKIMDELNEN